MDLLRIAVLLRAARVLQQLPGLAGRAWTETVGGRSLDAVADDLLLGDLLEVQRRLSLIVAAVDRHLRRVRWWRASRRRAALADLVPILHL